MHSSTAEMVEKKVLEMAQHASFHQHVSYNLSTILHALTAGKTDPTEIAAAFSRARGLEVITRVVSGEPVARPPVVSLCCGVARRVVDRFGPGVTGSQAKGVAEALVTRLDRGIDGDDAQTMDCQVECARLMSSIAGRDAATLLAGGALRAVEGMLERLAGKHSSIFQPCCEALERVSCTPEGKAVLESRGTAGVLLVTLRDCPDMLQEGSDAALASALKVVETIFSNKTPDECARLVHPTAESTDSAYVVPQSVSRDNARGVDAAQCIETLLAVAEATPAVPGIAAATCLWWVSGASRKVASRALDALIAAVAATAVAGSGVTSDGADEEVTAETAGGDEGSSDGKRPFGGDDNGDSWSWLRPTPVEPGGADVPPLEEQEEGTHAAAAVEAAVKPLPAARFLAVLCLCKPGLQALGSEVRQQLPQAVDALVKLCGVEDPRLTHSCFRVVERLVGSELGAREFVNAGVLQRAAEAGRRFERAEENKGRKDVGVVGDEEAYAIAAALGAVAALGKAGGKSAHPAIDSTFRLSVRCLAGVGEFSGRPAAAVAKAALDVITFRLTRSDRARTGPKGLLDPLSVVKDDAESASSPFTTPATASMDSNGHVGIDQASGGDENDRSIWEVGGGDSDGARADGVDDPMEILRNGSDILATMKAHPTDSRVQESGWRALIAMDTGRGDVEKFLVSGDGQERGRQMLRDCIKRHGGDSAVAGQVTAMLERLVLQGDSDGEPTSLATSPSEEAGEDNRWSGPVSDEGEIAPSTDDPEPAAAVREHEGVATDNTSGEVPVDELEGVVGGDGQVVADTNYAGNGDGDGDGRVVADANSAGNGDGGGDGEGSAFEREDSDELAVSSQESLVEEPLVDDEQDEENKEKEFNDDNADDNNSNGAVAAEIAAAIESPGQEGATEAEGGRNSPEKQEQEPTSLSSARTEASVDSGADAVLPPVCAPVSRPSPETVLAHLSQVGQKALLGDASPRSADESPSSSVSPDSVRDVSADVVLTASRSTVLARDLFGVADDDDDDDADDDSGGGGEEGGDGDEGKAKKATADMSVEPTEEELRLEESWVELERLHGDVTGRSQIIGGESADIVADMPNPRYLREKVGAALQGANGQAARGAFAASHLAIMGALTAATGALASSQREVQRYLTMSRDLHGTSTWKDMAEAMQWTMDSLKGTVVLFTPHTSQVINKDAARACSSEAAASKLFKEAALQIKIIVVELAGEHAPNTVWRIAPGKLENLPENRKIMVLRHLRSLVVAYDNLSELSRKDLTTALEIIKNREVLNKMGKICVEAEASEEQRNKARIATAHEKLGIGPRRASGGTLVRRDCLLERSRATFSRRSPSPNAARIPSDSPAKPSPTTCTSSTHTTRTTSSIGAGGRAPFFSGPHAGPYISPSSSSNNISALSAGNHPSPPDRIISPAHHSHQGGGIHKTPVTRNSSIRLSFGSDNSSSGAPHSAPSASGSGTGSRIPRGIASKSRRRDTSGFGLRPTPNSASNNVRSKSPVPMSTRSSRLRARSRSPILGERRRYSKGIDVKFRSKSPARSSSHVPRSSSTVT